MTPKGSGPEAEERLQTLTATQDGFKIAELDLKLRGPGEFVGTRQHGYVGLRIANLLRDHEWLARQARRLRLRRRSPARLRSHGGLPAAALAAPLPHGRRGLKEPVMPNPRAPRHLPGGIPVAGATGLGVGG
jgi:hypothetical protein